MNRFVGYYINGRKKDPNPLNKQLIFSAIARVIAECGTINDLKELVKYYEKETEELSNESITRTVSAS